MLCPITSQPTNQIKLHSSIQDDQTCECLSCHNLQAAIQRQAQGQALLLPRR